jgi:hypothetical protein
MSSGNMRTPLKYHYSLLMVNSEGFMRQARIIVRVLLLIIVLSITTLAQRVYPASGGTRQEPNPKEKDQIYLIAENEVLRLTIDGSKKNSIKEPLLFIWLKVENLSDKPLSIDPSKFSCVDDTGRAYAGLGPKEAIKRIFDSRAGSQTALGIALSGPRSGPALAEAAERKVSQDMHKISLQPGEIPPRSFKEGAVYFEAPQKQKKLILNINFTGLWPEPIVFSTEKIKSNR